MLSTSVPQYSSAFSPVASNIMSHDQQFSPHHIDVNSLDPLAHSFQFGFQYPQSRLAIPQNKPFLKHREPVFGTNRLSAAPRGQREGNTLDRTGKVGSGPTPVRRRISRACDQCNQLRTKCDGKSPCAHCIEFNLTCEYIRERKKRGKASRKDIQQQQQAAAAAAAAAAVNPSADAIVKREQSSPRPTDGFLSDDQKNPIFQSNEGPIEVSNVTELSASRSSSMPSVSGTGFNCVSQISRTSSLAEVDGNLNLQNSSHVTSNDNQMSSDSQPNRPTSSEAHERGARLVDLNNFSTLEGYQSRIVNSLPSNPQHTNSQNEGQILPNVVIPVSNMHVYGEQSYVPIISPVSQQNTVNPYPMSSSESPISGLIGASPVSDSSNWLSLNSPAGPVFGQAYHNTSSQILRYPVLEPLLPCIGHILPGSIACDLLDVYFESASQSPLRPTSPYILAYVFRKQSILRQRSPRYCKPALLASMLWIGAQTSGTEFLTSSPTARGKICQKLFELTTGLLRPLMHAPVRQNCKAYFQGLEDMAENAVLENYGPIIADGVQQDANSSCALAPDIDDVVTYMHLATVLSTSEYKTASLRWWNAAWSLARELRLGSELPLTSQDSERGYGGFTTNDSNDVLLGYDNQRNVPHQLPNTSLEERKEERRRIWWLLYIADRHLALCYNRPILLLDSECRGLHQPVHDTVWQTGEFYDIEHQQYLTDPTSPHFQRTGPDFECKGHDIFGYLLPLMTILGEIVDLNHARNHPHVGTCFRNGADWNERVAEITRQLEIYGQSLQAFQTHYMSSIPDVSQNNAPFDEITHGTTSSQTQSSSPTTSRYPYGMLQTRLVVAYGTCIMHILHILLNGRWDPTTMFEDNDFWVSSQSFMNATSHAISAAEAVNIILEHDSDFSFMPFFFGIYLLQGSFLLLLNADRFRSDAGPSVVRSCEIMATAHEACIGVLNPEYQKILLLVFRGALGQMQGLADSNDQQCRQRRLLAMYRWTGDGAGLTS